jgi:hypothetical protein
MLGPRVRLSFAFVLSIVVATACGDYSQPTSPPPAARKLVSPTSANFSRYILISGVWTLVDDDEGGDGDTARADTGGDIIGGAPVDEALPDAEALPASTALPDLKLLPDSTTP